MEYVEVLDLIGDDDDDEGGSDLVKVTPGFSFARRQILHRESDEEEWVRTGEQIGFVHMGGILGHGSIAICTYVFAFDDEDSIVAHGVLPAEVKGPQVSVGEGRFAVTGGTGTFLGVMGEAEVAVTNPKRYHIVINGTGG